MWELGASRPPFQLQHPTTSLLFPLQLGPRTNLTGASSMKLTKAKPLDRPVVISIFSSTLAPTGTGLGKKHGHLIDLDIRSKFAFCPCFPRNLIDTCRVCVPEMMEESEVSTRVTVPKLLKNSLTSDMFPYHITCH